jgi:hypothetical protein
MKTKCSVLVCVLDLVFTMSAVTASAAEFYAIVAKYRDRN